MNKFGAKNISVLHYHIVTTILMAVPTMAYFIIK